MNISIHAMRRPRRDDPEWSKLDQPAVIGQDVLELVSAAMYVDPLAIYREYVQNAADAADEARNRNGIGQRTSTRIEIELDRVDRSARITDNATGIPANRFVSRLISFGASDKRGTKSRGFRGVGRLAGLGFCRELVFRSRSTGESAVSEMNWDCVKLKRALREAHLPLDELLRDIVSIRTLAADHTSPQFFQVDMRGITRHRDDRLLNPVAVSAYLSEVSPIEFANTFPFKTRLDAFLRDHILSSDLEIVVNRGPILRRPHSSKIPLGNDKNDSYENLQEIRIDGLDGEIGAVGWIAHHSYLGAIPKSAGIKGLRLRTGNIQVGDDRTLEDLFREQRFNSWAVGEIHILDPQILPNGRRDNFEESPHFDNILNHLAPIAREIALKCRLSSQHRNWQRKFELDCTSASNHLEIAAQRAIGIGSAAAHIQAARIDLRSLEEIAMKEAMSDKASELNAQIKRIQRRLESSGVRPQSTGPLAHLKPYERRAFEHCFELLYDCAPNRIVATKLIDRVLVRLAKARKKIDTSKKRAARPRMTKQKSSSISRH